MANKEIHDYDSCPRCGGEMGYYQKVRSKGDWHDNTLFSGEKYNTEMMEGFTDTWLSKFYYCIECDKKICRVSPKK